MRFYDPIKGDILVNDQNIAEFDIKSLRKNIGFVSQRAYILNDTVAKMYVMETILISKKL